MSSLRKRLKECKESDNIIPINTIKDDSFKGFLLPYDLVFDYLYNHPVVIASNVHTQDIYNALKLFIMVPKQEEEKKQKKIPFNCQHCEKGYLEIDTKEGYKVCGYCGIQETRMAINIEPEFITQAEVDSNFGNTKIKGVSEIVIQMQCQYSDEYKVVRKSCLDDLEHWNTYTNLGCDDLKQADNKLKTISKDTSSSHLAKTIAVLLSVHLKDKLINEKEFRECLRNKTPMLPVETSSNGTFKCLECDKLFFTMKDARFHCKIAKKWGKRKIGYIKV